MKDMSNQPKVHVAINVNDIEESVAFYRAMFGIDPIKLKPGYAKFDVVEPPLNLTLNYVGEVKESGALNHLGIQVYGTQAVLDAKQRLQSAGLATFEEMGTTCCYALQDKVWVTDPNGYKWEVFVVNVGDTSPELKVSASESPAPAVESACCAPTCCT